MNIEIIWKEISNLSVTKDKVIEGYSKIDAYVINNEEVKANSLYFLFWCLKIRRKLWK